MEPDNDTCKEYMVKVNNLTWRIGDQKILDNVDFQVEAGQFVGVIGPNGAGKSSLLRCLYRVIEPSEGNIYINQNALKALTLKESAQQTAVILQETTDQLGLRVIDVVTQGLIPHKALFSLNTMADKKRIQSALSQMDLIDYQFRPYQQLSGGEKQRVEMARAIVQQPKLLIMDEPTNHLDIHYQIEILEKVKAMDLTVVASFHDLNIASAYCDQILVIDRGKKVAMGTPKEVLTAKMIQNVYKTEALVDEHPFHKNPRISFHFSNGIQKIKGDMPEKDGKIL